MLAGSLAARGAVTAADRELRATMMAAEGPARRWLCHAVLLLATASARPAGRPPPWLVADTSAGGLLAAGLWAAMSADTARARERLDALSLRPKVELQRLGLGPRLLQARIRAAQGAWPEVVSLLQSAAVSGEHDGDPDQVSSMAVRWLLADAYSRTGQLDSAAAKFELTLDPTRLPFSHLALRGLLATFARRRLAGVYHELHRPQAAARHWKEFHRAFVTPDPDLRSLWPRIVDAGAVRSP